MDAHGVQQSVIYHAQGEVISPTDGNSLLEGWLDDGGRLIPQWSVTPVDISIKQIEDLHSQGRVTSVRLHSAQPAGVGLPFRPWGYDSLLSFLTEVQIPLWIPLMDVEMNDLIATLGAYPELNAVLVGAHYTHAVVVRALLEASSNAVLELSRYEPIGEIEALVDSFGSHRLIYGSWYPRYAMGPMLFYLHHTRMENEDLERICSGNVKRLLELQTEGS